MDETKYITVSGLKARGWTASLIQRFLGKEDKTAENPHYHSAPMMRLYDLNRVVNEEIKAEFKDWKIIAQKRSIQGKKAAATRAMKLLEMVEMMTVGVTIINSEMLLKKAIRSYNDFHSYSHIYK